MTDNGAAMGAAETQRGLRDLGILHEPTLPYSPHQNAKQEVFWASVEGRRFEVPSRFRHLAHLWVRYARWDLGHVDLVDPRTGTLLSPLRPLDKARNAEGRRRRLDPVSAAPAPGAPSGMAPLLGQLLREYAATGLPPAYIPTPPEEETP